MKSTAGVGRVLVTGSTGFVGGTLCETLARSGHVLRAALRADRVVPESIAETVVVGDIDAGTDWDAALVGVDCVMHIAARAHVLGRAGKDADGYMETNAHGTRSLAAAAARAGVRRFVYLSSVKVNGEETTVHPFSALDVPQPQDAYGNSKWLGEQSLVEMATPAGMETVIVRSPLVYGPGVRANFLRLMRLVDRERPLPLGAVHNRRSLVSIWNLCDFLTRALEHSAAAGRTWMISDGVDLSTPALIRRLAVAMGRRARLVSVPAGLLRALGALTGRGAEVARLCGSLVVDLSATQRDLGWAPLVPIDEALARTTQWYLDEGRLHAN